MFATNQKLLIKAILLWLAISVNPLFANPLFAQIPIVELQKQYPEANFKSGQTLTRADIAAIALSYPSQNSQTQTNAIVLKDVPEDHWASKIVNQVMREGIMQPYRDQKFFPDTPITRTEGFSILSQVSGIPQISEEETNRILSNYADANQIEPWARKPLAVAIKQGFVNTENGLIRPKDLMTQGDIMYAVAQQMQNKKGPSPEVLNIQKYLQQARTNPEFLTIIIQNRLQETKPANFPWLWVISGSTLGLILLTLLILRMRKRSPEDDLILSETSVPTVKTLIVTESELPVKGRGTATIIQRNKKVRMGVAETPVTFGTGATSTYIMQNLAGVDQLFSIMATKDGKLQLISKKQGLTCDNKLVSTQGQGVILPSDRNFTVQYQQRQFQIQPSFEEFNPNKAKQNNYLSGAWN
jgi:hypothetical protein